MPRDQYHAFYSSSTKGGPMVGTPQGTDVSDSVSVVMGDIWGDSAQGTPQQVETGSLRGSLIRLT